MTTIKEVARMAGVSASTVSRALSNKIPVEESTRRRVMEAVKRLGYRPNLMAKGLREGVSHAIALIVPDIDNPFFPRLVQCIERQALEKGYALILCDSGNDADQELRHIENLRSHFVDGVLYIAVDDGSPRYRILRDAGLPVVMINRYYGSDIPSVTSDNADGAFAVVEYLISQGHVNIACLVPQANKQHYQLRYEGCVRAFRAHGIADYEKLFVTGVTSVEDAYAKTRELLGGRDRPTAIFAFSDILVVGVYSGAHACGLRIPEDVSVAGFDNIGISQHMIPPLTTYAQAVEQVAEEAVHCLLTQIHDRTPSNRRVEIKGDLIIRKSVASLL